MVQALTVSIYRSPSEALQVLGLRVRAPGAYSAQDVSIQTMHHSSAPVLHQYYIGVKLNKKAIG